MFAPVREASIAGDSRLTVVCVGFTVLSHKFASLDERCTMGRVRTPWVGQMSCAEVGEVERHGAKSAAGC